jgi:hypothetical protein
MTSSDAVTRRGLTSHFGWLARARLMLSVTAVAACLGVAGAVLPASAGVTPSGRARPVAGAVGQARPDAAVRQCFVSSAPCTSPDPTVTFTMYSSGDSTGCVFRQDTSWGTGPRTRS